MNNSQQKFYKVEARRKAGYDGRCSVDGGWFDLGFVLPAAQADNCVASMNKATPEFEHRKVVTRRRAKSAH